VLLALTLAQIFTANIASCVQATSGEDTGSICECNLSLTKDIFQLFRKKYFKKLRKLAKMN